MDVNRRTIDQFLWTGRSRAKHPKYTQVAIKPIETKYSPRK